MPQQAKYPLIGRILLRNYRIDEFLTEGGQAIIYKGMDLQMELPIAIKQFKRISKGVENDPERFRREARNQAQLSHPNIVTIRSVFEEEGELFIVMEYVDGDDLQKTIQKSQTFPRVPLKDFFPIAIQALKGLDYAHKFKVIHRDIKPSNILITSDHRVKLADFGLARAPQDKRLTQAGLVIGTPAYIAPEQLKGEPILDPRCDIYSLGITFYEALAGTNPYEDLDEKLPPFELIGRHLFMEPSTLIEDLGIDIPTELEAIIMKSIAKDPEKRYQTCEEFQKDLEKLERQLAPFFSAPPTDPSLPPEIPAETPSSLETPNINSSTPPYDDSLAEDPTEEEPADTKDKTELYSSIPLSKIVPEEEIATATYQLDLNEFPSDESENSTLQTNISQRTNSPQTLSFSESPSELPPLSLSSETLLKTDEFTLSDAEISARIEEFEKQTPPLSDESFAFSTSTGSSGNSLSYLASFDDQKKTYKMVMPSIDPSSEAPPKIPSEPFPLTKILIILSVLIIAFGLFLLRSPSKTKPSSNSSITRDASPHDSAPQPPPSSFATKDMVKIPKGYFLRGHKGKATYSPAQNIYLNTFWIDRFEVSQAQYKKCVDDGFCLLNEKLRHLTRWAEDLPITQVSWQEAQRFCQWQNKSLPTEAQWEKAARGPDGRTYPWGNLEPNCSLANFDQCGHHIQKIGPSFRIKGQSPYGVYDLIGNVWEWTQDCYHPKAYKNLEDINPVMTPEHPSFLPIKKMYRRKKRGPWHCYRVLRGGSWKSPLSWKLFAFGRWGAFHRLRRNDVGFRCALNEPLPAHH